MLTSTFGDPALSRGPVSMCGEVRMRRDLYDQMQLDLARPHDFAGERVGFAYGRVALAPGLEPLVLLHRYVPVPDDQYLPSDEYVALINEQAIMDVMREVRLLRGSGEGVFHVHMHDWQGQPGFSRPDLAGLPPLIPGFRRMAPDAAHGLLLLSGDHAIAWLWLPLNEEGAEDIVVARTVTVVGTPLDVWRNSGTERKLLK